MPDTQRAVVVKKRVQIIGAIPHQHDGQHLALRHMKPLSVQMLDRTGKPAAAAHLGNAVAKT